MATREQTQTERVIADRERYVARGVNTPPLVVAHAEGARIVDVDGKSYIYFDHGFHGRTILTLAMTSKVVPYKKDFGPLAPDVFRAPAPYPYRDVATDDAIAGLELIFKQDVDPEKVACMVLEPVQGEGGFIPMPEDFVRELKAICERHGILYVDDEGQ